jgi:hypothetical protein
VRAGIITDILDHLPAVAPYVEHALPRLDINNIKHHVYLLCIAEPLLRKIVSEQLLAVLAVPLLSTGYYF